MNPKFEIKENSSYYLLHKNSIMCGSKANFQEVHNNYMEKQVS